MHRSGAARPAWTRALGLAACRCEACLTVFDVPRRAAPREEEPGPAEAEATLSMPPPPEVDLTALDREMARRLQRDPPVE
ncbi:MAG TPA: hypothetical protein VMR21_16350 [Vicinamibacteria bacterium]|nr:hypothetical protein [Vicinamibacteria bacterium]